jgi:hypothetical protein
MQPSTCDTPEGCEPKAVKRKRSNLERFYSFVNKMGPIAINRPDLGRCHTWRGGKTRGYGIFWADGTSHRAHVWIYKQSGRAIPEGLELDHFACNRTDCVNVLHVTPVTTRVNAMRSTNPWAENARKEKCPVGHDFDEANTRINSQGSRECITCKREDQRLLKQAQRAVARGYVPLPADTTACSLGHDLIVEGRAFKDGTIVCLACTAPAPGWGRPRKAATAA